MDFSNDDLRVESGLTIGAEVEEHGGESQFSGTLLLKVLSPRGVIRLGLAVMDTAAVAITRENNIPIVVYSIHEAGALSHILCGGGRATLVSEAA